MSAARIDVQPDADALATAVAGALLARLAAAQDDGGEPHVCLTGGTIADGVHRELARLGPDSGVDWTRVVLWFGDERFVAPDSDERNALGARGAFLDVVGATQVQEVASSEEVEDVVAAADDYDRRLREHAPPEFEVVMLGVGPDAHVASLFPGAATLDVEDRSAVAVDDSPKPPPQRVSLTFPRLRAARSVWVVASGEGKAEAVAAALADDGDVHDTPARGVWGTEDTIYFLDTDAASRL